MQVECLSIRDSAAVDDDISRILRHALNIFHDFDRLFKDQVVDALVNIMHLALRSLITAQVSVMDVAMPIWIGFNKFAFNSELLADPF